MVAQGVDISEDVVEVARQGIYRANAPAVAGGLYDVGSGKDIATELAAFEGLVDPSSDSVEPARAEVVEHEDLGFEVQRGALAGDRAGSAQRSNGSDSRQRLPRRG